MTRAGTLLLAALTMAACGDNEEPGETPFVPPAGLSGELCGAPGQRETVTSGAATHISEGIDIPYNHNPPCIGSHYPIWLDWGLYETPVNPSYYVHNLEHGGIVFLYDCPEGCPGVVEGLESFARSIAPDDGGDFRWIVMPFEGTLPTRVAAVSWGQMYLNSCVNPNELSQFVADNYRKAPEDVARTGFRPGATEPPEDHDNGE
jgi:hypothetical protein